ncbi:MAG TPA: PhnD/SsuA/transferrin family substrate-binding protein [Gemmataceae bacterium]|nr:PhnD/SsuA/transferrin family substrate-binding protein [Pirellulales bacterium]HZZ79282.1 PhnD/SsuA/transferrin family substrate-binding protein [Gemmataceae bacterium]
MMVAHGFDGDRLDDLRGKTLATYPRVPLMEKLFLTQVLAQRNQTPRDFFGEIKECKNVRDAIVAVNRRKADCVLVNAIAYSRQVANQPGITLRPLVTSGAFAAPVIVGRPSTIDSLRAGLWHRIQEETLRLHRTPEGKQCMHFWRLSRFGKPNRAFDSLVQKNAAEYPINVLLRLHDEPDVLK